MRKKLFTLLLAIVACTRIAHAVVPATLNALSIEAQKLSDAPSLLTKLQKGASDRIDNDSISNHDYSYDEDSDIEQFFENYSINNDYIDNHILLLSASNTNGAILYCQIIIPDNIISLAPGTYPINYSATPQTVYAGEYADYLSPSFFAFINLSSNYAEKVWFLISGEMIVYEGGYISINATNSLGRNINLRIGKRIKNGDLFYNIDHLLHEVQVAENNQVSNKLIVPDSIIIADEAYAVTSISNNAFKDCDITSVVIPNCITSIGSSAFFGCDSLVSVVIKDIAAWCKIEFADYTSNPLNCARHLFMNETEITNLVIPNGITSIGNYAFYRCLSLTTVTIPSGVTSIGREAFAWCYNLTSITIPNSITNIGEMAFCSCSDLTSIKWNAVHCNDFKSTSTPFYYYSSSSSYQNYDLRSQITSFTIGDEVEYIPAYLCAGMNKAEITLKNCKTEIGSHALDNCMYAVEGAYNIVLPDTTLCYGEELVVDGVQCTIQKTPNTRQTWTRSFTTVEGCDSTITISVLWKRVAPFYAFKFMVKDVYDTPNTGSISWTVSENKDYKYDYYTINGKKNGSTTGLKGGEYRLAFYSEECNDSVVKNITINQLGIRIKNQYYLLDNLNHTATLTYRGTSCIDYNNEYSGNITVPQTITYGDEEYQVTGIGYDAFYGCNNITTVTLESKTPLNAYDIGLTSNAVIYVPYGSLSLYKADNYWKNYKLRVINPSHISSTTGATSATITLGAGDEVNHIASCGIVEGESTAGNILEYIGLEPNSTYSNVPFYVITAEGDSDVLSCSFKTTALELTTKESKAVSSSTALLFAETNMSDVETNCGFEWKRENAPESMAGTKVYCPVASGQMAGRLKNLKDDVYYKYRAFYQSTAGNMYYGDWQYIFTGDVTVEFDPVLYTYTASAITETSAIISGYALAGSEDFTEQGFEYWAESRANNGANAPARKPAALGEHVFVKASGINMRVSLTDLDAGTIYKYRAYAKVGDQIYYGSEQSFTTSGTYTPPTYVITFVNWDGTELQSSPVAENTLPEYTGEQPTRPNDEEFSYSFKGWTPEIVIATEDATYTATFEKTTLTAISNIKTGTSAQKVLRNGQIFILRGEKVYTLTGQAVK